MEYLFDVVRSRCVQMRAQSNGHQWDSVFIVVKSVCFYIVVVVKWTESYMVNREEGIGNIYVRFQNVLYTLTLKKIIYYTQSIS